MRPHLRSALRCWFVDLCQRYCWMVCMTIQPSLRKRGSTEKVSVRKGETTEREIRLEESMDGVHDMQHFPHPLRKGRSTVSVC